MIMYNDNDIFSVQGSHRSSTILFQVNRNESMALHTQYFSLLAPNFHCVLDYSFEPNNLTSDVTSKSLENHGNARDQIRNGQTSR